MLIECVLVFLYLVLQGIVHDVTVAGRAPVSLIVHCWHLQAVIGYYCAGVSVTASLRMTEDSLVFRWARTAPSLRPPY